MTAEPAPSSGPRPRRPIFASVRARLVALLVVATVPALGAAVVATIERIQSASRDVEFQARLASYAVATRVSQRIESVRALLVALAQARAIRNADEHCTDVLRDALAHYADWLTNISTLDAEGRLNCSVVPTTTGRSFADSAFFAETKAKQGFVLGPFQAGGTSGERISIAAFPVMIEGRFAGTVATGVRIESLLRVPADVPLPVGTLVMFRDSGGETVRDPRAIESGIDWPAEASAPVLVRDQRGVSYRFMAMPIDDDLSVAVAVPSPTWARLWTREAVTGFGTALLLLALCFAVVFYGTYALVIRPIRALTRAVRSWNGADRQFQPPPLIAQAPAELRSLAQAFDSAAHELAERGDRLTGLAEQRGQLVREMHHRVKNNLQIVSSMLSLQERRAESPGARAALRAARDRISALVVLHKHLYADDDLRQIGLREYLGELATTIHDLLEDDARDRIRLETELVGARIAIDRAVPVALVVAEALTEAFKFAFPGDRTGTVRLRATQENDEFVVAIEDDGVEREENREDGGLGPHLMEGFARQIGGRLGVDRGPGGTIVKLVFAASDPPPARAQPAARPGV